MGFWQHSCQNPPKQTTALLHVRAHFRCSGTALSIMAASLHEAYLLARLSQDSPPTPWALPLHHPRQTKRNQQMSLHCPRQTNQNSKLHPPVSMVLVLSQLLKVLTSSSPSMLDACRQEWATRSPTHMQTQH